MVSVSAYVAHNDPELWGEDVQEFKPERFLEDKHPTYAFLPFGAGTPICLLILRHLPHCSSACAGVHACPGRFFAIHEIKTLIATFLRLYDIDVPGGRPPLSYVGNRLVAKQEPVIFTKLAKQQ